jgi:hypothetical protein
LKVVGVFVAVVRRFTRDNMEARIDGCAGW